MEIKKPLLNPSQLLDAWQKNDGIKFTVNDVTYERRGMQSSADYLKDKKWLTRLEAAAGWLQFKGGEQKTTNWEFHFSVTTDAAQLELVQLALKYGLVRFDCANRHLLDVVNSLQPEHPDYNRFDRIYNLPPKAQELPAPPWPWPKGYDPLKPEKAPVVTPVEGEGTKKLERRYSSDIGKSVIFIHSKKNVYNKNIDWKALLNEASDILQKHQCGAAAQGEMHVIGHPGITYAYEPLNNSKLWTKDAGAKSHVRDPINLMEHIGLKSKTPLTMLRMAKAGAQHVNQFRKDAQEWAADMPGRYRLKERFRNSSKTILAATATGAAGFGLALGLNGRVPSEQDEAPRVVDVAANEGRNPSQPPPIRGEEIETAALPPKEEEAPEKTPPPEPVQPKFVYRAEDYTGPYKPPASMTAPAVGATQVAPHAPATTGNVAPAIPAASIPAEMPAPPVATTAPTSEPPKEPVTAAPVQPAVEIPAKPANTLPIAGPFRNPYTTRTFGTGILTGFDKLMERERAKTSFGCMPLDEKIIPTSCTRKIETAPAELEALVKSSGLDRYVSAQNITSADIVQDIYVAGEMPEAGPHPTYIKFIKNAQVLAVFKWNPHYEAQPDGSKQLKGYRADLQVLNSVASNPVHMTQEVSLSAGGLQAPPAAVANRIVSIEGANLQVFSSYPTSTLETFNSREAKKLSGNGAGLGK